MTADEHRLRAATRGNRVRRTVVVLALLVVGAFIAAFLAGSWEGIVRGVAAVGPADAATALGAALVGVAAAMLSWRSVLAGMGSRLPVVAAARVYFLSQLGKYVPGSLWPIAAQAELSRELHVPTARSAFAALTQLLVSVVVGVVVAGAALVTSAPGSLRTYGWLLPVAAAGVVALVPTVFNRLLRTALRLVRRPDDFVPVPGRALAASAAWCVLMWFALGVHLALLLSGPAGVGVSDVLHVSVGAYALAWVVGFVVVVLPAGAGAREAALLVTLAPVAGAEAALAVALVSRVVLLAADLASAGAAAVAGRRRRPPELSGGTASP